MQPSNATVVSAAALGHRLIATAKHERRTPLSPPYAPDDNDKYRDDVEYRDTFVRYLSWKKF